MITLPLSFLKSCPIFDYLTVSRWIHNSQSTAVSRILRLIFGQILLCRTQTACFVKSKCSLSHMLLTPGAAWLGTCQVGRGVVSILKWVGTHCGILVHWNSQKSLTSIWQHFSCRICIKITLTFWDNPHILGCNINQGHPIY